MFSAVPTFFSVSFNLVVAMASARYCSGVERIPEHISVVIFVNSSSFRFGDVREIFGSPRRVFSLYHRAMSETLGFF